MLQIPFEWSIMVGSMVLSPPNMIFSHLSVAETSNSINTAGTGQAGGILCGQSGKFGVKSSGSPMTSDHGQELQVTKENMAACVL